MTSNYFSICRRCCDHSVGNNLTQWSGCLQCHFHCSIYIGNTATHFDTCPTFQSISFHTLNCYVCSLGCCIKSDKSSYQVIQFKHPNRHTIIVFCHFILLTRREHGFPDCFLLYQYTLFSLYLQVVFC